MVGFPMIVAAVVLALPLALFGQTSRPEPETKSFELTPTPPPVPALKYELLYDVLSDRVPGNAATLYMQTAMMMGVESPKVAADALEAYEANDLEKFDKLAEKIDRPPIFKNLDVAARRDKCDWDPPIRQLGAYTFLPQLEPFAHGLTTMIMVHALAQMEHGKLDEAIETLRLGYEMSDKVGREPTLVSGLVALGINGHMNDVLTRLMNRPNAPNLYWALMQMPSGRGLYRNSLHVERRFLVPSVPNLYEAIKGAELTPQEWHAILDYMAEVQAIDSGEGGRKKVTDSVKAATAENLKQAREMYAKQCNLKAEQVEKIDPVVVLGNFYVRQAEVVSDDIFKLRNLPYPELFKQASVVKQRQDKLKRDTPGTPFLPMLDLGRTTARLAQADRQRAAMVNVEAIRSYAAANSGKLPSRLEDITDTPAMENPWTGEPFEYAVKGDVATLADSRSTTPLTYTIRIRK